VNLAEKVGLIGLAGWVVLFVVVIVALRNRDLISRWWFDCVRGGYPFSRPLPNGPLNDYDVHLIETTALAAMAERVAVLGAREAGMLGSYAEMLRTKVMFLKHERFLIDYVLSAFDPRLPVVVIGPNMGTIAAACALLGRQAIAVERDPRPVAGQQPRGDRAALGDPGRHGHTGRPRAAPGRAGVQPGDSCECLRGRRRFHIR